LQVRQIYGCLPGGLWGAWGAPRNPKDPPWNPQGVPRDLQGHPGTPIRDLLATSKSSLLESMSPLAPPIAGNTTKTNGFSMILRDLRNNVGSLQGPSRGPPGRPGTPQGSPKDPPGFPGDPPKTPKDPQGPPRDPQGRPSSAQGPSGDLPETPKVPRDLPGSPQGPSQDPPGTSWGCSCSLPGTAHSGTAKEIMLEPAVSSLQPTAGCPQTGPAECAERLNKTEGPGRSGVAF